MEFATPLISGRLVKRYKRFLADIILDSGEAITAACPNTGSMMGLKAEGARVFLSKSDNPKRKYAYTWELVERPDTGLIGINTARPNALVEEAIQAGLVPMLTGYSTIRREVAYGTNSRIDLLLEGENRPPCFVEVKNVTLFRTQQTAEFPDCVTARGAKHLVEMASMVAKGNRAVMVYLIQGGRPESFKLASDLDPAYASAFADARKSGVEAVALTCHVSPDSIAVSGLIPVQDSK